MVSLDLITKELKSIKLTDFKKKYLYIYAVMLNGLAVAKQGSSQVNVAERIYNYLNKEHSNQQKGKFFMLAALEFPIKTAVTSAENFLKKNITCKFNVFNDQPQALEQYQLQPYWLSISPYLKNFPFSTALYINDNADELISQLCKEQKIDYESIPYVQRQNSDNSKNKLSWIKKVDDINKDPSCIEQISGIGNVSVKAFKHIILKKHLPISSLDDACHDIEVRIKEYNAQFGRRAKYDAVIKWLNEGCCP